jgi:hypothetical protein
VAQAAKSVEAIPSGPFSRREKVRMRGFSNDERLSTNPRPLTQPLPKGEE